jgi:hypothetical protein
MRDIFPDLLRSVASDAMVIILLFSLAHPRKKKWVIFLIAVFIIIDAVLESSSYFRGDYTSVVKINLYFGVPAIFCAKLLFSESFAQWCFNVLTAMNIFMMTVFISYHLSDLLPFSLYANTVIRVVLMGGAALLFYKKLRPLYSSVLERWYIYVLPSFGIFSCFAFLYLFRGDIEDVLVNEAGMLILLCVLSVFVYVMIFWSLKSVTDEYDAREEAARSRQQQELLTAELEANEEFINAARQSRHDLRHHDAIVLEYLQGGEIEQAKEYLRSHDDAIRVSALHEYCLNRTANAVLRLYEKKTAAKKIVFSVSADIPENLPIPQSELGGILSNILENALEACERSEGSGGSIHFSAEIKERLLLIELRNTSAEETVFKDGLPVSGRKNGGFGTRSVLNAVTANGGMAEFSKDGDEFIARIVLPTAS